MDHVSPQMSDTAIYLLPPFQTSPEYQQLRWMRVAILKRRKAPHTALLEGKFHDYVAETCAPGAVFNSDTVAFRSIIDHMQFSESTITEYVFLSVDNQ